MLSQSPLYPKTKLLGISRPILSPPISQLRYKEALEKIEALAISYKTISFISPFKKCSGRMP